MKKLLYITLIIITTSCTVLESTTDKVPPLLVLESETNLGMLENDYQGRDTMAVFFPHVYQIKTWLDRFDVGDTVRTEHIRKEYYRLKKIN